MSIIHFVIQVRCHKKWIFYVNEVIIASKMVLLILSPINRPSIHLNPAKYGRILIKNNELCAFLYILGQSFDYLLRQKCYNRVNN